jgi:cyclophilin family peptidyl-prolyl cis-trans isomerase
MYLAGAAVAVVGAIVGITAAFGGDDKPKVNTTASSTTTPDETTSTTPDETTSTTAAIPGDPNMCPAADGSSPKATTFGSPPVNCIDAKKKYVATMTTDVGVVKIELDQRKAPKTVNNFVFLARYHYYDGLTFHRVIPDFVIQGGDPMGTGSGGPGYQFEDELPEPGDYKEGSLAMANSGPNTNGSQFFIMVSEAGAKDLVAAVGGTANYSLFGQVIEGMDVVKKIEADSDPSGSGKPTKSHRMESVTIEES